MVFARNAIHQVSMMLQLEPVLPQSVVFFQLISLMESAKLAKTLISMMLPLENVFLNVLPHSSGISTNVSVVLKLQELSQIPLHLNASHVNNIVEFANLPLIALSVPEIMSNKPMDHVNHLFQFVKITNT
jgi:hypothetical protein